MRPVIGVSCYGERARWGAWDIDAVVLHRDYVRSLEASGAAVVVLPPLEEPTAAADVVARLDGLVLAGGADVDPASYGAAADPTTDRPRTDRDATEVSLWRAARAREIPVLGICRGMQVMAVAEGGSLVQDLPSAGYGLVHRERPGAFTEHGARFATGSLAAAILGPELVVNSSHHQAVADPGSLTVTGWAEDGTIETVEDVAAPFILGVQWHPEMTEDRRLFAALVTAARAAAAG